ncbi:BgTH12-07204 [Blumeria graminis f. sp. triticale]|uniref:BgTH12-07204 n=1 Tax=Blumeria graminis f. sp. triticale TaxID=1689686 RepID=A0A9W4D9K1_BLUGR|nr:BgTH12-07204 [Blumeria graminis f. sp. triticale]
MKTVPSLIASSTIGVAAAGLSLGKLESSANPTKGRNVKGKPEVSHAHRDRSSLPPRSDSSLDCSTCNHKAPRCSLEIPSILPSRSHRRPPLTHVHIPKSILRERSTSFRHMGSKSPSLELSEEERKRSSFNPRRSWIRRLTVIPVSLSQPSRESVALDSPLKSSLPGTGTSITASERSQLSQSTRNKLVKRSPSRNGINAAEDSGRTNSRVSSTRRPATSHQRSLLWQKRSSEDSEYCKETPLNSPHRSDKNSTSPKKASFPDLRGLWRFYFESRPTLNERTTKRSNDYHESLPSSPTTRRVVLDGGLTATLIKPQMIDQTRSGILARAEENGDEKTREIPSDEMMIRSGLRRPTTKSRHAKVSHRPYRSLSMQFTSPTKWLPRAQSLQVMKNRTDNVSENRNSSSLPSDLPCRKDMSGNSGYFKRRTALNSLMFQQEFEATEEKNSLNGSDADLVVNDNRNIISPLPSLSRTSSFNIDLLRIGHLNSTTNLGNKIAFASSDCSTRLLDLAAPASNPPNTYDSSLISSCFLNHTSKSLSNLEVTDCASTLIGSDSDHKGYSISHYDETDFHSDTVFDSLRSGATGSTRSCNPPLEYMFDQVSSASHGGWRKERLSLHEDTLQAARQDEIKKFAKVKEGIPIAHESNPCLLTSNFTTTVLTHAITNSRKFTPPSPQNFTHNMAISRTPNDPNYDDDDDNDSDDHEHNENEVEQYWAANVEPHEHPKFPPKPGSLDARKVSPGIRALLADVSQRRAESRLARFEKPMPNILDWSDPPCSDRNGPQANPPKLRTVHVRQKLESRGGRTLGRRGPSMSHIRSQSVPLVPDFDYTKSTSKFGTWGLGPKAISEDWDGDFEFDNTDCVKLSCSETTTGPGQMVVPEAIRACQENIVGHVGQIREVCLQVEEMKRLRGIAKYRGLLQGEFASLWLQAEGIIALAAPVDEEEEEKTDGDLGEETQSTLLPTQHYKPNHRKTEDDKHQKSPCSNASTHKSLDQSNGSTSMIKTSSSTEVARKVMETIHQQRSALDPLLPKFTEDSGSKMPFDTTSLKDLVGRAITLNRILRDVIRATDGSSENIGSSRRDSSPAFTRVFTEPADTPKRISRNTSNNSIISASVDKSPTQALSQRMNMMTVV